jgi:hypothetical protein
VQSGHGGRVLSVLVLVRVNIWVRGCRRVCCARGRALSSLRLRLARSIGFGLVRSRCRVVRKFWLRGGRDFGTFSIGSFGFSYSLGVLFSNDIAQFLEASVVEFGMVRSRLVPRGIGRETAFRKEIAVRDVGFVDGFADFFGAVSVADAFEGFFGFVFEAFGVVFGAEFFGGLVAVFLEDVNLAGKPAEDADRTSEFFGFGGELFAGFGFEEELGQFGGNELKADFGELAGVIFAEVFEEIVLEEAGFECAILCDAPVAIAATSFPVGDVAFGDSEVEFAEGVDDLRVRDVVAEHAVDHVADGVGEAGDFAVASA